MPPRFVFVVSQYGSESTCKAEILANHPGLKVAFSRPGFLTFKDEDGVLTERFILKSTFARTYGWSIGNLKSADFHLQQQHVLQFTDAMKTAQHLHVWQRDVRIPGRSGFEPGSSVLAAEVGMRIQTTIAEQLDCNFHVNRIAKPDERVFDVILVEPDYWFVGHHHVSARFQRWPGGTPLSTDNKDMISRAYLKLQEALLWSGIHIQQGDVCAELGSSPGGACQLLLEKGAHVIAIDPADMDEVIAKNENLNHFKCRGKDVRKKELKDVRWLLSDLNATPSYTLDAVKEIITNQNVSKVRGLILTLKLSDLKMANDIPKWVTDIRELGFQVVKTRQLAFNRQEICLVAVKDKFALRSSKRPAKQKLNVKP